MVLRRMGSIVAHMVILDKRRALWYARPYHIYIHLHISFKFSTLSIEFITHDSVMPPFL